MVGKEEKKEETVFLKTKFTHPYFGGKNPLDKKSFCKSFKCGGPSNVGSWHQ
jgi:hypothetical protein